METLEHIERRIESVEDLRSIIRMMKTLAAVNIRRYEVAARAVAEHAGTVEDGFHAFLIHRPLEHRARPESTDRRPSGAVVLGSDRGLCGGFNDRAAAFAADRIRGEDGETGPVVAVGMRVDRSLRRAGIRPATTLPVSSSLAGVTPLVDRLLVTVDGWITEGRLQRLVVIHNRRLEGVAGRPRLVHLYPLAEHWLRSLQGRRWPARGLPVFTMPWRELLSALTRELLFVSLYRAAVESMESESASRLEAMQAAERKIEERLGELQADFRRERQSRITAELLDIVAGYEATSPAAERPS